jgi:hypothetical protein
VLIGAIVGGLLCLLLLVLIIVGIVLARRRAARQATDDDVVENESLPRPPITTGEYASPSDVKRNGGIIYDQTLYETLPPTGVYGGLPQQRHDEYAGMPHPNE